MVKKVLRHFVVESTALYLCSQIASGLVFEKGIQSLIITGVALTLAGFVIKPILTVLLLPINLVTFNFFRWANHAITLFLVDLALKEFNITHFQFLGLQSDFIDIPAVLLPPGIASYLAFSFVISIIAGLIYWLVEK
jgi:uncharacterized membrane protein YvlD (DUF360 family)